MYVLTTVVARPVTVTADDPEAPVADAVAPVQPVTAMLTVAESDMGVPESVGVTVAVLVACRQQQQQKKIQCRGSFGTYGGYMLG